MLIEAPLHGVRDRMLALRSLPNYANLRDDSLLFIAEHARERRFRPGEVLLEEGVPVERIYIIVAGSVTLSRAGKPVTVIEAPGGVGILSSLAGDPDGRLAAAATDTLTLEIPTSAFISNLEEDFALMRNSLRILSGKALESRGNLPVHPKNAPLVDVGEYPDREQTLCERIIGLRSGQSPFANANMDAVFEVARRMTLHRVEPGKMIFDIGEPSTFSARINYGRVRCTAPSGEHVDVGMGMVLGALDSWSGTPRSFSARAETQVIYYQTPYESFLTVLEMHPSLAMTMLRGIAQSLLR